MKLSRWVSDFGNSINQHMIDGSYFEMPSSVHEVEEMDVEGLFVESVPQEDLLQQLVIRTKINGECRYFKVGEKAKADILGNAHIDRLHDKTESVTVWVTWLAGIAFFHAYKYPEKESDQIDIQYFLTMLPT